MAIPTGSLIHRNSAPPFDALQDIEDDELVGEEIRLEMPEGAGRSSDSRIDYMGDEILVDFGGGDEVSESPPGSAEDHYANLALFVPEAELSRIAEEILDMIEADEESMEPWRKMLESGLKISGLIASAEGDLPFPGASTVTHPLIAEAIVQFNARAFPEILPPAGPCKGQVNGEETDEKREQAERVEDHMNFQMTVEDEGYYDEMDQLLYCLPLPGCAFTKTYFDETLSATTSRYVRAENMVVPYTAVSIHNTPRYGERLLIDRNEMRRRMESGMYRDIELVEPEDEGGEIPAAEMFSYYNEAEGKEPIMDEDDPRHTVYEEYIEWDLQGFEDTDESGAKTGIALPYIISIDHRSRRVLAIYRNWRENDPLKRKRCYHTHYKYLPGFGMMGSGLLHHLGGLNEACTGSIRALLDSAAFATLQGGFKSKEARLPAGKITITPGEWMDVDLTAEELSKAFYTPPFKEPSRALFELLNIMQENGRRYAGTTEAVVGDASSSGPVGTTVALIEQGTKVMTGIHRRLHRAQAREFKIRAEINAENLPEGIIYYDVAGGHKYITADDYSNRNVTVIPVSDPNIVSKQQRIAVSQGMLELMTQAPQLYKAREVHLRILNDMDVDDADRYLVSDNARFRFDPLSEGSRLLASKPIHVFQDQMHEQHLAMHMTQMEYLKTLPPEQGQVLMMHLADHMAKHEAYRIYQMVNMQAGGNLPPLDLYSDDPENQLPPEMENAVTQQVARYVGSLMAEIQANQPPPPEDMKAKAEIARKDAMAVADERRKEMAFQNEERRKEKAFDGDQSRMVANAKLGMADRAISQHQKREGEKSGDKEKAGSGENMEEKMSALAETILARVEKMLEEFASRIAAEKPA